MTRIKFTQIIVQLLTEMIDAQENCIIDWVKRSTADQVHLYEARLSKCDGVTKKSAHQTGRAMDIYFINENDEVAPPKKGFEYWHKRGVEMGLKPMIEWDKNHFEAGK